MKNNSLVIIASVLSFYTPLLGAGFLGPDTYEDCILESMKGTTSDVAAKEIQKACRKKFPEEKSTTKRKYPDGVKVPTDVLDKVDGKGGMEGGPYGNRFTGHLKNNTHNWIVYSVEIVIYPKGKDDSHELTHVCYELFQFRTTSVGIRPFQEAPFSCDVDLPRDFNASWYIRSAKGKKFK